VGIYWLAVALISRSAVQAGIGLAAGIGIVAAFPVLRRRMPLANAVAGVLILLGAGFMLVTGY
jgi:hypothetical protein